MKPCEIFRIIRDEDIYGAYTTSGDDVQWRININNAEKTVYLIFQESSSNEDWHNNFSATKRVYKNQDSCLKCHKGFVRAYKSCNDIIMDNFIKTVIKTGYKPIIVGWSFGGAMVQLACEDFNYRTRADKNDVGTGRRADGIAFGAPRVCGNKKTADYILSCCSSFVNYAQHNDIVAMVPFNWMGYRALPTVKIGYKFNILKIFDPWEYHTQYDYNMIYKM